MIDMNKRASKIHFSENGIALKLLRLGVIKKENIEVFASKTRDREDVVVYKDKVSSVVFIDGFYTQDEVYEKGEFRDIPKPMMSSTARDFEDFADTERRIEAYKQFIVGKNICDFGCGAGSFLRRARSVADAVTGIELNARYCKELSADGIDCRSSIADIEANLDTVFLFHSFEHLADPAVCLKNIKNKLKEGGGGCVVIEVPHAQDFMIQNLGLRSFIEFTLWSQHLILHTRESLSAFLREAGFRSIIIEGVQRYGLSNHIRWLGHGRPGGHKTPLSIVESTNLKSSYADALSRINANDTIVAVATT